MILYCATTNPGKLREFKRTIHPPIELLVRPGLESMPPSPETGTTFEENARQKAEYYSAGLDHLLFAEDSGLEVDSLNGAPGVYSARFAGPNATDADNNRLLLERLQGASNRAARYVCCAALARNGRTIAVFRGEVAGRILEQERGAGGFGYDPLFFYEPFGCTFAEVPLERKLEVSHRTAALRAMLSFLENTSAT